MAALGQGQIASGRITSDATMKLRRMPSSGLMKLMKKTGRPLILTVNGKPEAVIIDASAYQEVTEQLDTIASIRRGLVQAGKAWGGRLTMSLMTWNAGRDLPGDHHAGCGK